MDEVRFAHIIITAIGRLCEKCDGKWWVSAHVNDTYLSLIKALYSPVCDSYVRPETLVRICDECNFGTYGGRCIICGSPGASSSNTTLLLFWQSMSNCSGISDAYYCAECTRLEKDRDGCPKIVNLGASRTDLFYERRRLGTYFYLFTFILRWALMLSVSNRFQERLGNRDSCCYTCVIY